MVDGVSDHQPRGWRGNILDPVRHQPTPQQCWRDAALLGAGRVDDTLVWASFCLFRRRLGFG